MITRCGRRSLALRADRCGATSIESYDVGEVFRTVDGIATSATGEKMAWLKDPEGNLVSTVGKAGSTIDSKPRRE
jgi:hypothetical protein